jgi:hypothetical protein
LTSKIQSGESNGSFTLFAIIGGTKAWKFFFGMASSFVDTGNAGRTGELVLISGLYIGSEGVDFFQAMRLSDRYRPSQIVCRECRLASLMKKILLAAGALVMASVASAGNWYGQQIGPFDYWHGPNGAQYTGQQIGNSYYWNGHDQFGNFHSGTGQRIGNFYYWNDQQ